MTTCVSIVNTALRKLGKLASGREARPQDATDALLALRGMYTSWIVGGAFGRLDDVIPLSDYTARENQRIFRNVADGINITLPETVNDNRWPLPYNLERDTYGTNYEGVLGDARTPRDGAVVVISDSMTGESLSFIYDKSAERWQNVDSLELSDNAPRSAADPLGLASCLAIEISDQFGGELQPATMKQAARYAQAATYRMSTPRTTAIAPYF